MCYKMQCMPGVARKVSTDQLGSQCMKIIKKYGRGWFQLSLPVLAVAMLGWILYIIAFGAVNNGTN